MRDYSARGCLYSATTRGNEREGVGASALDLESSRDLQHRRGRSDFR